MNKLTISIALLSIALTSCEKDPIPNPDGTFPECIELYGTLSTPLILTNHVTDPGVPDYCISGTYFVQADLVVEPGVFIQMKDDSKIHIRNNGSFNCVGTATAATGGKIIIKAETANASGQWDNIHFSTDNMDNQLVHTNISGGGNDNTYDGMVYIGHQGRALIDNCYISLSSSNGIKTESTTSHLGGISVCTIASCGLNPIQVSSRQVAAIGPSIISGGNGIENIEVRLDQLQSPATWNIPNVPLHISGVLSINSDLIVKPNVSFLFGPNARMQVTSNGSLNCIGSNAGSGAITFKGDTDVPGSWGGIVFLSSLSQENRFEYCHFSYGGSSGTYLGMVTLWTTSNLHISNSSFSYSEGWGVFNNGGNSTYYNDSSNSWIDNAAGDFN